MNPLIKADGLAKDYRMGEVTVHALVDASFEINEGEFVVILGPSGSGKSTLLNILGGMDTPSAGKCYMEGTEITGFDDRRATLYRRYSVGFVFQFYNLMANLTAKENVELATEISEDPLDIGMIMDSVGLGEREDHFPSQLSGGEQQRVSIARAIAKNPKVLLCDEPTGALDFKTGITILELLKKVNKELNMTVIVITHNSDIASMGDRIIRMRSGEVIENRLNDNPIDPQEIRW
ncbi:MAG: ABC transporter ATP-binding protein [Clostridiales Family XIII bacterium]|jgi:putative ABC transport system ATP-binding protein|nr:ABC transporter ATP-binding protein [Clostridiales Family XIII bacterium]